MNDGSVHELKPQYLSIDSVKNDREYLSWYTSDGKDVYYRCQKLENSDPETFKLINKPGMKCADKNNRYRGGTIVK